MGQIVALAGGVGAARFLEGLTGVVSPKRILIIGNTGDDAEIHGLHVSPDLDTVMYTLAGLNDPKRGWGLRGDTFTCLKALGALGADVWFQLGDRDLATHIYRTVRLRDGAPLSRVTRELARRLGVESALTPVTDHRLRTLIETARGRLEFQTWFVRRRARDRITGLVFDGATESRPAPGVLDAIASAEGIIICPSNPLISIGPMLAVPGVREALREARAPVAAVSPIVGGRALKGPAAAMMKSLRMRVSPLGVAEFYKDLLDVMVLDRADKLLAPRIELMGIRGVVTATVMSSIARKRALARATLQGMGIA